MTESLTNFIETLDKELTAYNELYVLLQKEKDALVKWDMDEATIVLFAKEELVDAIQNLEEDRMNAARKLGEDLFPGAEMKSVPTFREIIERFDGQLAEDLSAYRKQQIELVNNVRNQNARNSLLMKKTVELISGSINAMIGSSNTPALYDETGKYKNDLPSAKLVDGRI